MSFLETVFGNTKRKDKKQMQGYWRMLGGYSPVYTTFSGGVYEMELTRACVNTYATHCSKLRPILSGKSGKRIENVLKHKPNPYQTTSQFIRRTATALAVNTTAFVFPLNDSLGRINGYFSTVPQNVSAYDINGELWFQTSFAYGESLLVPASEVGVLTDYQYKSDLFGDGNSPLSKTLDLLNAQNIALETGIRNSQNLQFIGKISGQARPETIASKRHAFSQEEISGNASGLMLYDNTFDEVKQLDNDQWTIDTEQYQKIRENVFANFGTNDEILQSKADEQGMQTYYDAKIEPFALQLGEVLTAMTFNSTELSYGNEIEMQGNTLDFMTQSKLLTIGKDLVDRAVMTPNELRAKVGLPPVDGGNDLVIRGEYILASNISDNTVSNAKAVIAASGSKEENNV